MRLMLLTFNKDVRRLWPAAAITWVMLAALANTDRWRADWIASPMEAWMNLILTLAGACVAALAVLEEPLVGDANFWTTRPHPWPSLLVAKLLFVSLAIHVPSFLADCFVLAARGFSPVEFVGELLWKQVLLFGAVTLPSIALASVVRSFTHFIIAVFAIASGLAILNGGLQTFPEQVQADVRHALVRIVLAGAALGVIGAQYASRRAMPARVTAVVAGLAAASLSTWLPLRAEYVLHRQGTQEAPRISLRSSAPPDAALRGKFGPGQPVVLLPISIARGAGGEQLRIPLIDVEIVAPDGSRIRSVRPSRNRPFEKIDLMSYPLNAPTTEWVVLNFSGAAWDRVKNSRVHVRGSVGVEFYHDGETASLPAQGSGYIPHVGRCTSSIVLDRFSQGMLKVLCESPRDIPPTWIKLRHGTSGREWQQSLNSSMTTAPGPHQTWLSPLHRAEAFFHLTGEEPVGKGAQWLLPRSYIASSRNEVSHVVVTGRALSDFDFGEIDLAPWFVGR